MGAPARSSAEKLGKRALFIIHLGFVSVSIHELRASLSTVHETSLANYLVLTDAFQTLLVVMADHVKYRALWLLLNHRSHQTVVVFRKVYD